MAAAAEHPRCDLFIVGAPKCGTTALHQYLGSHPGIFMSPVKEPSYFGWDLDRQAKRRYTAESYAALFTGAAPEQWCGEASVLSLMSETAAAEIATYNPDARIVIMLRDPVEMLAAYHGERLAVGTEDLVDLAQAIAAWPDRRQGRRLPWNRREVLEASDYLRVVDFAPQVRRFQDAFPAEQIHVIFLNDMRADTLGEIDRCLAFLGLEPHLDETPEAVHISHVVRRPRFNRIVRSDAAERLRDVLPDRLLLPIGRRLRRAAFDYAPRPPVDPVVEARLVRDLAPGVAALEEVLGRGVPWRDRYVGVAA